MAHGMPRKPATIRLDPELIAKVRVYTDNLTVAAEEALHLWLWVARVMPTRRSVLGRQRCRKG
jgi:hypothetical protein